jgi:hypothetical protein
LFLQEQIKDIIIREEWTREEGKQGERKTRIEERHGDREGDT